MVNGELAGRIAEFSDIDLVFVAAPVDGYKPREGARVINCRRIFGPLWDSDGVFYGIEVEMLDSSRHTIFYDGKYLIISEE